jgi:hypothetical protein
LPKSARNSHIGCQLTGSLDGVVHQRLPMERGMLAVGFVMASVFHLDMNQFQRSFQRTRHSERINDYRLAVRGSTDRRHNRFAATMGIPDNQ